MIREYQMKGLRTVKCTRFFLSTVSLAMSIFIWSISVFGQPERVLKKSEALMTEGKFYEALAASEPLLTTDQRSESQEQALWQANALCETLVKDRILVNEFERERENLERREWRDYVLKWEKVALLNQWGAEIGYNEIGASYHYHYGFLKQLVERYPNSNRRPSAEYYFIEKRYNELEPVESWLNVLHAYVKKYAHSGIQELYAAYLDIAHINDGFWAVLTYPDGTYSKPFESGDPTLDKERAAKYKAEALKYYAKVIISGYAGRYYPARRIAIERFEALKQNKKSGYSWIIYD